MILKKLLFCEFFTSNKIRVNIPLRKIKNLIYNKNTSLHEYYTLLKLRRREENVRVNWKLLPRQASGPSLMCFRWGYWTKVIPYQTPRASQINPLWGKIKGHPSWNNTTSLNKNWQWLEGNKQRNWIVVWWDKETWMCNKIEINKKIGVIQANYQL